MPKLIIYIKETSIGISLSKVFKSVCGEFITASDSLPVYLN